MRSLHWPVTGSCVLMVFVSWRSVLTVMVDGVSRLSGAATHGCLQLIDLAGMGTHDRHGHAFSMARSLRG